MPKTLDETTLTGDIVHQWTVQEYEQHQRRTFWYIFMIILGLALVLFAMATSNFLFALIIILFSIILFLQSHQEPVQVPFAITELGVVIANRFYSYTEFENFYIIYNPPRVKMLFLVTKSIFRPVLRIPLLDQDPLPIRNTLEVFLQEDIEKEQEPLSDRLGRNWGIH